MAPRNSRGKAKNEKKKKEEKGIYPQFILNNTLFFVNFLLTI